MNNKHIRPYTHYYPQNTLKFVRKVKKLENKAVLKTQLDFLNILDIIKTLIQNTLY